MTALLMFTTIAATTSVQGLDDVPTSLCDDGDCLEICGGPPEECIGELDPIGIVNEVSHEVLRTINECLSWCPELADVQFDPSGPKSCAAGCDPTHVEYFLPGLGPEIVPPQYVTGYVVGCDVLLPSGHTVWTLQVNLQDSCGDGTKNCQGFCFTIIDKETPGINEVIPIPIIFTIHKPICQQNYELWVQGVRLFEGPIIVPC